MTTPFNVVYHFAPFFICLIRTYISLISTSESFVVSAVSRLVSSASAVSRLVRHVASNEAFLWRAPSSAFSAAGIEANALRAQCGWPGDTEKAIKSSNRQLPYRNPVWRANSSKVPKIPRLAGGFCLRKMPA